MNMRRQIIRPPRYGQKTPVFGSFLPVDRGSANGVSISARKPHRRLTSHQTQFQPRQVVDRLAAPILGLPQDSLGLDAKLYERAMERRLMRVTASHR
jgi:hypothetical protein